MSRNRIFRWKRWLISFIIVVLLVIAVPAGCSAHVQKPLNFCWQSIHAASKVSVLRARIG